MSQKVTKGTIIRRSPPCPCDQCFNAGLDEPKDPDLCETCQEWKDFVELGRFAQ